MVRLVIGTLFLGAAAGLICGGRLSALCQVRLRALPLAFLAAAVQAFGFHLPRTTLSALESRLHVDLVAVVFTLTTCFLMANLRQPRVVAFGVAAVLLGAALNGLVIAANGSMPVSATAIRLSAMDTKQRQELVDDPKHQVADERTNFASLGDVVPLSPFGLAVSLGDVLLLLGCGTAVAGGTLSPRRTNLALPAA